MRPPLLEVSYADKQVTHPVLYIVPMPIQIIMVCGAHPTWLGKVAFADIIMVWIVGKGKGKFSELEN